VCVTTEAWGVMLARSLSLVRGWVYPSVLLVGLVLTVGWVGLLGYGLLALIGY
jgi:hypothetical protein